MSEYHNEWTVESASSSSGIFTEHQKSIEKDYSYAQITLRAFSEFVFLKIFSKLWKFGDRLTVCKIHDVQRVFDVPVKVVVEKSNI
jgi:hypothetical protein